MRSVLFAILIFTLAAGLSYAQPGQTTSRKTHRAIKPRARGITQYNVMLRDMLIRTEGLELTEEQVKKIDEIRTKYLKPLSEEMREQQKLRLSIYKMLQDPSFDPAKVHSKMDEAYDMGKKTAGQFVDGITALRDAIGPEKYKEMNSASFRYKNDLIQLREKQLKRIKTSPPPAAEDGKKADSADKKDDTGGTDKQE
jgi:Spy/CpxP family protein refolding chaperone